MLWRSHTCLETERGPHGSQHLKGWRPVVRMYYMKLLHLLSWWAQILIKSELARVFQIPKPFWARHNQWKGFQHFQTNHRSCGVLRRTHCKNGFPMEELCPTHIAATMNLDSSDIWSFFCALSYCCTVFSERHHIDPQWSVSTDSFSLYSTATTSVWLTLDCLWKVHSLRHNALCSKHDPSFAGAVSSICATHCNVHTYTAAWTTVWLVNRPQEQMHVKLYIPTLDITSSTVKMGWSFVYCIRLKYIWSLPMASPIDTGAASQGDSQSVR